MRAAFIAIAAAALAIPLPRSHAAQHPLKGIVLWRDTAAENPELGDAVSLEFMYLTPCTYATGADPDGTPRFDWTPLDAALDDIASRGHQAIVRFRYEYPGESIPEFPGKRGATAVPKFIKERPDYHESFSQNPGGDGPTYYADWSCPALQDFTIRLHEAFAERYDADPRVAFIEVGFGHWAEYHTHGTPVRLGVNFPTKDYQEHLMRRLDAIMLQTPWLVSIDAAQTKYSDLAASPALSALGFGLFDDSFMHRDHDFNQGEGWNEQYWRDFGPDRWRRAPCGGEVSYYQKKDQREFLSPKGVHGVTWEQAAAKYHMTFVIGNDSLQGKFGTAKRLAAAAENCGYRFRLVDARHERGKPFIIAEVANDGVAPLYHDAYLALESAQGSNVTAMSLSRESLRGLLPGESRLFRIEFKGIPDLDSLRAISPKLLPGTSIHLER
ncbi:MAG: DUF4832 domain-containing protein [Kiritimatiellae bacterium]|nr:DUF4832 domain-containing protein [Kiritimatiellia bacterium]